MGELEQLGERIAEQAAHLDAAMHRLLADLREFDQRGRWHVVVTETVLASLDIPPIRSR